MKQKQVVTALLLAVLFLQTGCGAVGENQEASAPQREPQQTQSSQWSGQDTDGAARQPSALDLFLPVSEKGTEEKTVELQVRIRGERKTVRAVPYIGGRYTLSVVKTWERLPNEPRWQPKDDGSASLTVRYYTGKKTDAAVDALKDGEKEYAFYKTVKTRLLKEDSVSMLHGVKEATEDGADRSQLTVYFIELERGGTYALLLRTYGAEGEEWEGYLKAMANSFALSDPLRIAAEQ